MKTLVVWNEFSEGAKLLLFDEDLSRFHEVFINQWTESEEVTRRQDELNAFVYNTDTGKFLHDDKVVDWTHPAIFKATDLRVVHCGFLP